MTVLEAIPFSIDVEALATRVHVDPEAEDAVALRALVDRVQQVARPKALYDLCFIDARSEDTVQINGVTFTSRVLAVNLADVHRVFPYVVTCGTEFDTVATEGDPLQEYWLDQIRLEALGTARAYLQEHLDRTFQPGKMSNMHPGSLQDWPISQQVPLFSLLGDVRSQIGVQLTDSYLMLPLKSVSGIFFPTEVSFASCQLCPRDECPGRSAPYEPELWKERYAKE